MLECCTIPHCSCWLHILKDPLLSALKESWGAEQWIPCRIGSENLYLSFLHRANVCCDIKYRLGWREYSAALALRSSMEEGQEIGFPDPSSLPGMMPKRSGLICVRAELLLIIFFLLLIFSLSSLLVFLFSVAFSHCFLLLPFSLFPNASLKQNRMNLWQNTVFIVYNEIYAMLFFVWIERG